MRNRQEFLVLSSFILMALVSFSVEAVGLSSWGSVVKEVDFIPGTQQTFDYMLRTTVGFTQDYELSASGDLAHLVTFSPGPIFMNIVPGQDPWCTVIVNFPVSDENITPGMHTIGINLLEGSSGGGTMGGRTAVSTRIMVRVLHPGKYILHSLNFPSANIDEPIQFSISLENWGKETINEAKAKFKIYTSSGEFKGEAETQTVSVPSAGGAVAYGVLDTLGYLPGDYYAEGIIYWDGQQTPINATFRIGTQDIKVNWYTATFEKDKINPFKINVESIWNSMTSNVYATIDLPNGQIQTPTIDLGPWQNANLTAYWEAMNVSVGKYDTKITLHYADKTKTKTVSVDVMEKVVIQEEKPFGVQYPYLIALIVVLILVNVSFWLFYIFKKK